MKLTLTLPGQTEPITLEAKDSSVKNALALEVREMRPGHFQVEGTEHPYYVSVQPDLLCCCYSSVYGSPACKHVVAVLLKLGGSPVREQAEGVVAYPSAKALASRSSEGRPGVDISWPSAMARALRDPGESDLLSLSRVITDPALTEEEALKLAIASRSPIVINALTRIPRILRNREIRGAIANNASHISTVARLMPYCDPEDFRPLFRALLRTEEYKYALDVLHHSPPALIATLQRQDLLPLFSAADPDVRTSAMAALTRVMDAEKVREATLPDWNEGEPLFEMPEKPLARGRRR